MSTQAADLHRSLLRPAIIHTLRGTGFHSTKPSVLDALVALAEKYLILLATTTAQEARAAHNDGVPTIHDVRQALTECSALVPYTDATDEEYRELLRRPIGDYVDMPGRQVRMMAELIRREEQDTRDLRAFLAWLDGPHYAEIKRVAGSSESASSGPGAVGVGGALIQTEDILTSLTKRRGKGLQDAEARFANTVLGSDTEDTKAVVVEGGKVSSLRAWIAEAGQFQRVEAGD